MNAPINEINKQVINKTNGKLKGIKESYEK